MATDLHMQGPASDGVLEAYANLQQTSARREYVPAGWLLYTDHRHGHEIQRQWPHCRELEEFFSVDLSLTGAQARSHFGRMKL